MYDTVHVTIELSGRDAQLLRRAACAGDILLKQPWRFELPYDEPADEWGAESVLWCLDPTSGVLLRADERAHGFASTIAVDMAEEWPYRSAVLSTRTLWEES